MMLPGGPRATPWLQMKTAAPKERPSKYRDF